MAVFCVTPFWVINIPFEQVNKLTAVSTFVKPWQLLNVDVPCEYLNISLSTKVPSKKKLAKNLSSITACVFVPIFDKFTCFTVFHDPATSIVVDANELM